MLFQVEPGPSFHRKGRKAWQRNLETKVNIAIIFSCEKSLEILPTIFIISNRSPLLQCLLSITASP